MKLQFCHGIQTASRLLYASIFHVNLVPYFSSIQPQYATMERGREEQVINRNIITYLMSYSLAQSMY